MSEQSDDNHLNARIKVVGVGGGGGNAVNTMIAAGLHGVDFISANTDAQALSANLASIKLQIGSQVTKGLGAGGSPEMGRKAATEDLALKRKIFAQLEALMRPDAWITSNTSPCCTCMA